MLCKAVSGGEDGCKGVLFGKSTEKESAAVANSSLFGCSDCVREDVKYESVSEV